MSSSQRQTVNIGNMRHLVNLQTQTKAADGYGGFTTTWYTKFPNVWAEISQPSGSDVFMYGRMIEKLTTKINIRYNQFVAIGWQVQIVSAVVNGGKIFIVRYVTNIDDQQQFSNLFCEELV